MERKVFTIEEAVAYINDMGFPASKSTLYKQTMVGSIRFQRFGQRKLVFRQEHLDEWIESRLSDGGNSECVKKTIAAAARRKEVI